MSNEDNPEEVIRNFLSMTPAQRVSASDQAQASVAHEMPHVKQALDKTSGFAEELVSLASNDPISAGMIMEVTEGLFRVLRDIFGIRDSQ